MRFRSKQESIILLFGDLISFVAALWLSLLGRFQSLPSREVFGDHLLPFGVVFVIWILVYFIAGLYVRRIITAKVQLVKTILLPVSSFWSCSEDDHFSSPYLLTRSDSWLAVVVGADYSPRSTRDDGLLLSWQGS